jgi:hypothetical protein
MMNNVGAGVDRTLSISYDYGGDVEAPMISMASLSFQYYWGLIFSPCLAWFYMHLFAEGDRSTRLLGDNANRCCYGG